MLQAEQDLPGQSRRDGVPGRGDGVPSRGDSKGKGPEASLACSRAGRTPERLSIGRSGKIDMEEPRELGRGR